MINRIIIVVLVVIFLYIAYKAYYKYHETFQNTNVMILYFAPWCGYCKKLMPTWNSLKKKMGAKVQFTEINCDDNKEMCTRAGIIGYPTIRLITKDKKVINYEGDKSEEDLIKFATM